MLSARAVAVLLLLAGAGRAPAANPRRADTPAPATLIDVKLPSGRVLKTELMLSPEQRALGLMFRPALPADSALLFAFDTLDFHGIWMKNCRFPIDIVWLDEKRRVVHVAAHAPPCKAEPCAVYQPMQRALYVVEVNAGLAAREKLTLGAQLEFSLPR